MHRLRSKQLRRQPIARLVEVLWADFQHRSIQGGTKTDYILEPREGIRFGTLDEDQKAYNLTFCGSVLIHFEAKGKVGVVKGFAENGFRTAFPGEPNVEVSLTKSLLLPSRGSPGGRVFGIGALSQGKTDHLFETI